MANTNLIYTYIQDSGYKLQYVASVLHISIQPRCFQKKWLPLCEDGLTNIASIL